MSVKKTGFIWIKIRGERPNPRLMPVEWTSKTDLNRILKFELTKWAKVVLKNQGASVDVTTLDTERGGSITINGETEPCCRFGVGDGAREATPPPVEALFALDGAK